jgi:outer membrane receptor protein involved in Fe transport
MWCSKQAAVVGDRSKFLNCLAGAVLNSYRVRSARATPRRGLERQLVLNGFRDDAQSFRELYNAQSVEALKGPSAITFGRNAVTRTLERLRRLSRPLSRGGRCRQ